MPKEIGPFEDIEAHAEFFSTTPRSLQNWMRQLDGLPHIRLGKKPLFNREWSIEWLASRRQQKNPVVPRRGRGKAA
jgi:hypothetical protein